MYRNHIFFLEEQNHYYTIISNSKVNPLDCGVFSLLHDLHCHISCKPTTALFSRQCHTLYIQESHNYSLIIRHPPTSNMSSVTRCETL
ncbi:unnamed protein product [Heterobilharzia americana]|nr:unnamed protein product [Heterobilharzia americana]